MIKKALGKTTAIDERGRSCYTEDAGAYHTLAKSLGIDYLLDGPADTLFFRVGEPGKPEEWRFYIPASDFLRKHKTSLVV